MKRNTINEIIHDQPIRQLKKNKSCQLNQKIFNTFNKNIITHKTSYLISSIHIVNTLIH